MHEPKHRLNKKDAARWHELLVRDCCQLPDKPGGKVKPNPKYPPLTRQEQVEFERLQRKRSRKIQSHPKVKESLKYQRRHNRKLQRLLNKIEDLIAEHETKPKS